MTLFRTVEPAVEPVSVAEAKARLRIGHDSEDELIGSLIAAARDEVERTTGRALIAQSWRLSLDGWPRCGPVLLRRGPVTQILSITVFGREGEATVLAPDSYLADLDSAPARLHLDDPADPAVALNGIEIDFAAGYGEAGADVPDILKRAIMLLVGHWYEFRAAFGVKSQPVSFPKGYERLIAGYTMPRL
jgi:uncharacterized phiE125 gp8 family phage protein